MKKIFRYVLLVIIAMIAVRVLVHFITKEYYKDFNNYEIAVESPKIEITESKLSKNKGYIKGKATNNTDSLIENIEIVFEFYNENGTKIGNEVKDIKYFNVNETVNFDIKYEYKNISKIKVTTITEE